MHSNILLVAGTRPEALKLAPLARGLHPISTFQISLVWTGQHARPPDDYLPYSWEYLPPPPHPLPRRALELALEVSLLERISRNPPAAIVVQGDTTSAYAGARAARAANIRLIHLEAGLRTFNPRSPYPEEIYRRRITEWADLHLAPSKRAAAQLEAEGVSASNIAWVGSTAVDGLGSHGVVEQYSQYDLLVDIHRRENAGRALRRLTRALELLSHAGWRIALLSHPNTEWHRRWQDVSEPGAGISVLPAMSRERWWNLVRSAVAVLSDSGGAAEELPYLGVPLLIFRRACERLEPIESGHATLLSPDRDPELASTIIDAIHGRSWPSAWPLSSMSPYGDGRAGKRAAATVAERLAQGQRRR